MENRGGWKTAEDLQLPYPYPCLDTDSMFTTLKTPRGFPRANDKSDSIFIASYKVEITNNKCKW